MLNTTRGMYNLKNTLRGIDSYPMLSKVMVDAMVYGMKDEVIV